MITGDFGEIRDWVFSNVEIHAVGDGFLFFIFIPVDIFRRMV